jgi:hypothetical protein
MGKAFNEMGTLGKLCIIVIVAYTVKDCVQHVTETIRMNKAASSK